MSKKRPYIFSELSTSPSGYPRMLSLIYFDDLFVFIVQHLFKFQFQFYTC